jgi:hypothetical protein
MAQVQLPLQVVGEPFVGGVLRFAAVVVVEAAIGLRPVLHLRRMFVPVFAVLAAAVGVGARDCLCTVGVRRFGCFDRSVILGGGVQLDQRIGLGQLAQLRPQFELRELQQADGLLQLRRQ